MMENEIKEATLEDAIYCAKAMACIEVCEECRFYGLCHTWCDDVYRIIIQALQEIQEYKAIGTVEQLQFMKSVCDMSDDMLKSLADSVRAKMKYEAIGTVEEFKALKLGKLGNKGFITIGQTMEEYAQAIREKVIDEFAEALYNKSTFLKFIESDDYGMLHFEEVYELAEQMKGEQNG